MQIRQYTVGPIQTNCYILIDEENKDALVVDPAPGSEKLFPILEEDGLNIIGILLTHAHFDHMGGAEAFHERYDAPRYLLQEETRTAMDPGINLSGEFDGNPISYEWDSLMRDGQMVEIGTFCFEVLHTPGHTPGGACFYFEDEKVLLSGDSLFEGSVGRTDFPEGSMSDLVRSLREKVLTLPEDVQVLPGHGGITDIGTEKHYNPYLSN